MEQLKLNNEYFNHPIFHKKLLHLNTPAMKNLHDELHHWLWTGSTGGLIPGTSRVGKTTAILAVSDELYTRGKIKIPVYYISIPDRDQHNISSIFKLLCFNENLRVKSHDSADNLSNRFIHYIADKAVERNCQDAVLVVDEMQRLRVKQFNAFAEIYDKLLLLDINLTVIFIANDPEVWQLVELIEEPKYAHIHGRFFMQGLSFKGLTSAADVKVCLNQYDTLRYPKDGLTYTEYFLPKAIETNWKLSSLSNDMWRVFREYQKQYKLESWGMKYFTVSVNTLLSDMLPEYGIDNFDDEMMHECIRLSKIIPSLVRPVK